MCKKIVLFEGTDTNNNNKAERTLDRLKGLEIETVTDYGLLENRVKMPFIETDEGHRYYGVESIESFVEQKEKKK